MSCDNDHDSEDEVTSEKSTESVVDEFQAVQKKLLSLSFNPGNKDQLWLTHMWFQEENLEVWEKLSQIEVPEKRRSNPMTLKLTYALKIT